MHKISGHITAPVKMRNRILPFLPTLQTNTDHHTFQCNIHVAIHVKHYVDDYLASPYLSNLFIFKKIKTTLISFHSVIAFSHSIIFFVFHARKLLFPVFIFSDARKRLREKYPTFNLPLKSFIYTRKLHIIKIMENTIL